MIITLLIQQYITLIQENAIKKQTQGKSTSQQQMATLIVIMQRSRMQHLHTHCAIVERKKEKKIEGKQEAILRWPQREMKRAVGEAKPSRGGNGLYKLLWESTKGLPPGRTLLISKQVHSVMPSYPIMCLWYVWCSLTLLMAALWYHRDRWDTQLSRLLTSIFYCSTAEHLAGQGNREWREGEEEKKQPDFHCINTTSWNINEYMGLAGTMELVDKIFPTDWAGYTSMIS